MMRLFAFYLGAALLLTAGLAQAQTRPLSRAGGLPAPGSRAAEAPAIEKLNAWTVGLAGGQLEGAPIRFAAEIGRVVDDGDNLHVLPIVTRGPAENVEALLYLRGVDAAIINADSLEQFTQLVPNIRQRIAYILNLFPSELHIFVRPGINSLADLKGKKVNFNTPGTTAAYSGPLIFDKLKLEVEKTFIPHQIALEQMKAGQNDMAAVVFLTSKPVEAFVRGKWEGGFHFLPVPFEDFDLYLPSALTSKDYPGLIPEGQAVQTIAVPTILAAFNWARSSDRYRRVARLTETLFDRLDKLREPGFHPAWKNVSLDAKVPGLNRFPAAQEWLDRHPPARTAQDNSAAAAGPGPMPAGARQAAPDNPAEQERLFQEFLKWKARQQ